MLAGRPHEAAGNGSPRWMAAGPRKRVHRTRPTGQLARRLVRRRSSLVKCQPESAPLRPVAPELAAALPPSAELEATTNSGETRAARAPRSASAVAGQAIVEGGPVTAEGSGERLLKCEGGRDGSGIRNRWRVTVVSLGVHLPGKLPADGHGDRCQIVGLAADACPVPVEHACQTSFWAGNVHSRLAPPRSPCASALPVGSTCCTRFSSASTHSRPRRDMSGNKTPVTCSAKRCHEC